VWHEVCVRRVYFLNYSMCEDRFDLTAEHKSAHSTAHVSSPQLHSAKVLRGTLVLVGQVKSYRAILAQSVVGRSDLEVSTAGGEHRRGDWSEEESIKMLVQRPLHRPWREPRLIGRVRVKREWRGSFVHWAVVATEGICPHG
jgi:hypothetical protein